VVAVLSLALGLVLAIAPAAQAQSPAAPSQFCNALTAEEVSAAMGVEVTVGDSTDVDCTYQSDFSTGAFLSLNVRFDDSFDLEVMKTVFPNSTEIQVTGLPALITEGAGLLYLGLPNGGALTLQLIGTPADGVDLATAMTSLAALAVPRLSSIPLPTPIPQPSMPSFHQDTELEALFPDTIGGQAYDLQSVGGEAISMILGNDPDTLQQLNTFLTSIGKSLSDVSMGVGFFVGPPAGSIIAVRIRGTDMPSLAPQIIPLITSSLTDPQQTEVQVGGKTVTKVNPAGAPDEQAQYLYPRNEVLWAVSTVDPALTEVFGALP
jgi:hypothetical protein